MPRRNRNQRNNANSSNSSSTSSNNSQNTSTTPPSSSTSTTTTNQQNNTTPAPQPPANGSTSTNSNQAPTTFDIGKFLKKVILDHKDLLASVIVIFGIIISALGYCYYQGYYKYFGVSTKWINTQGTSFFYSLIIPISAAIILMLPNIITAFPILARLKPLKLVVFEVTWILDVGLVLYFIVYKININHPSYIIVMLLTLALYFLFISDKLGNKLDIIVGISLIIIFLVSLTQTIYLTANNKDVKIESIGIISLIIMTILIAALPILAWLIIKLNRTPSTPSGSQNQNTNDDVNQKIKSHNIVVISTAIMIVILLAIYAFMLYSFGESRASQEKQFDIIMLDEEIYDNTTISTSLSNKKLQELSEEIKNGNIDSVKKEINDFPFVQIVEEKSEDSDKKALVVKRVINSYVVISENDDNYLVINAFADSSNNKLYIFKGEKRVIEKTDLMYKTVDFENVPTMY